MISKIAGLGAGVLDRLFKFSGRSSRLAFWRVQLICSALIGLVWILGLAASLVVGPWSAPLFLPILLLLIPLVAVGVRRVHDRGRDWRWLVLLALGPYLLAMWASLSPPLVGVVLMLAATLLNLWGWVELGLLKGDPGPNAYGPPPRLDAL